MYLNWYESLDCQILILKTQNFILMWNIGNGKNEGNENLKQFLAKWRWCLENGRMPVHLWKNCVIKRTGKARGLKLLHTPQKNLKWYSVVRLFLYDVPFYHYPHLIACYGWTFSIPPSCRISIHGSFLSWRVYLEWVLYLECTLELPVDQSRRQQPVNIIQFQRSDQSTGLN